MQMQVIVSASFFIRIKKELYIKSIRVYKYFSKKQKKRGMILFITHVEQNERLHIDFLNMQSL